MSYMRVMASDPSRGPIHIWQPDVDLAPLTVVYIHGLRLDDPTHSWYVDQVWEQFQLAEKFAASGIPATFVAAAGRVFGKDKTYWPALKLLLAELEKHIDVPDGSVAAIGHSGAFSTIAPWLDHPRLRHVTLLDGLYGYVESFKWFANRSGVTLDLVNATWGAPRNNTREVVKTLSGVASRTGLPAAWDDLDPDEQEASVLDITAPIAHMEFVTSSWIIPLLLQRTRRHMFHCVEAG